MKLKITAVLGIVFFIAVCSARPAVEEDYAEYEEADAPPPPPPKPAARVNPLLNRRNPLSRNAVGKPTSTTAAPPPAPQEEEVEAEEEEIVEEVPAEPSSTTEQPKKLKTSVRPFRSNDDLLAALKRRREQAASSKTQSKPVASDAEPDAPAEPVTAKPARASTSGRRRFNKNEPANDTNNEQVSSSSPARTGRRFNGRS